MKYVMIRLTVGDMDRDIPFIFPDAQTHSTVSQYMCHMLRRDHPDASEIKPISAGFLSSVSLSPECYGESETLKLKSRKEDGEIIVMYDYHHGIVS